MKETEISEWLKDKPREVSIAIVSRAALRVSVNLPLDFQSGDKFENLTFTSLRCLLISSLAAKMPSDDIISALSALSALSAYSAYSAARSFALSARSAYSAYSAARSAASADYSVASALSADSATYSALSATFEIWPEVEWDMEYIGNGKTAERLIDQPLFNTPKNNWSPSDIQKIENLKSNHPEYSWWARWLIAMHDGKFKNWDLAYRIATEIPDETWKQGATPVAEKITELQIQEIEENPPVAENLVFNEQTKKFGVEPISIEGNFDIYEALLERVQDALEDATTGNRLNEFDYEVIIIQRTLTKYRDNPQRVEMDFMATGRRLEKRLSEGDLPEDTAIYMFSESLLEGAQQIRGSFPKIRKARNQLHAQKLREMPQEEKSEVTGIQAFTDEIFDDETREEFAFDLKLIANVSDADLMPWENLPKLRVDASERVVTRLVKVRKEALTYNSVMSLIDDTCSKIEKNPIYRGTKIVTTAGASIAILTAIISYFLNALP